MIYCKQINLPKVPLHLIDDLDVIVSRRNAAANNSNATGGHYASYDVSKELNDYLQSFFKEKARIKYLVISKSLPIHIDAGTPEYKYNYVIQLGGNNVETVWYDSMNESRSILHKELCDANVWYSISNGIPHTVNNLEGVRIIITAKSKDGSPLTIINN